MPIYEYECGGCGKRHEFIQKFSDSPKRKCPACGKQRLKKLISAAAFHLKGDGWYVTDFRDKDKKQGDADSADASSDSKDTKSDAASDSKSESKSESKSDAKSDAKSDSKDTKKDAKKKSSSSKKSDSKPSAAA